MGEASRKADDAMFRDPILLELMTELRATAVNLKIDMTDAFSEFVPHGPEGALGIMPKNRFRAALGTIFKGAKLSDAQLKQVSIAYGTGDPDPREPGTRNRVLYKQFAIDFDEIPLPAPAVVGALDEAMLAELRMLKRAADNKRLDMTDAFAEFAPPGKDTNLGVMPKNRFRSAMGVLFQGCPLTDATLLGLCKAYAVGTPDLNEEGTCTQVQWKKFAIDFDELRPTPDAKPRVTDPALAEALSKLRAEAGIKHVDLSHALEEYAESGKDTNLGLMPKHRFCSALGVIFPGCCTEAALTGICAAYGAGPPDKHEPGTCQMVQFKRFADDFDEIPFVRPRIGAF